MEVNMKRGHVRAMAAMLSLSMAIGVAAPGFTKNVQAAKEYWNDASYDQAWEDWKANQMQ